MFRYRRNCHDTYIWDPEIDRFILIRDQKTWDLYTYNEEQRHLLLRDLLYSRVNEKGEKWTLCQAFMLKLTASFGNQALGLESLGKTRLRDDAKYTIKCLLHGVLARGVKVNPLGIIFNVRQPFFPDELRVNGRLEDDDRGLLMPGDESVTLSTCIDITANRPPVAPSTGQGITPTAELPTTGTNTAPATTQPLRKRAGEISPGEQDPLEGTHILCTTLMNRHVY
jgi:hypothetical protein